MLCCFPPKPKYDLKPHQRQAFSPGNIIVMSTCLRIKTCRSPKAYTACMEGIAGRRVDGLLRGANPSIQIVSIQRPYGPKQLKHPHKPHTQTNKAHVCACVCAQGYDRGSMAFGNASLVCVRSAYFSLIILLPLSAGRDAVASCSAPALPWACTPSVCVCVRPGCWAPVIKSNTQRMATRVP